MRIDFREIDIPKKHKAFDFTSPIDKKFSEFDYKDICWKYDDPQEEHRILNLIETDRLNFQDLLQYRIKAFFDFAEGLKHSVICYSSIHSLNIQLWLKANYIKRNIVDVKLNELYEEMRLAFIDMLVGIKYHKDEIYKETILDNIYKAYGDFEKHAYYFLTQRIKSIRPKYQLLWVDLCNKIFRFKHRTLINEIKRYGSMSAEEISEDVNRHPLSKIFGDSINILMDEKPTEYEVNGAFYSIGNIITARKISIAYLKEIPGNIDRLLFQNKKLKKYSGAFRKLKSIAGEYIKYSDKPYFQEARKFANESVNLSYSGTSLFKIYNINWYEKIIVRTKFFAFILEPTKAERPIFILNRIDGTFFRNKYLYNFFSSSFIKKCSGTNFILESIDIYNAFSGVSNPNKPIKYWSIKSVSKQERINHFQAVFIDNLFHSFE